MYLTLPTHGLSLYRSDQKWSMVSKPGAAQSLFSSLDGIQNRLRGLVGDELLSNFQPLSHRQDTAILRLVYQDFRSRYSGVLHYLFPPVNALPGKEPACHVQRIIPLQIPFFKE